MKTTIYTMSNGDVETMELYFDKKQAESRADGLNAFNKTTEWKVTEHEVED